MIQSYTSDVGQRLIFASVYDKLATRHDNDFFSALLTLAACAWREGSNNFPSIKPEVTKLTSQNFPNKLEPPEVLFSQYVYK